MVGKGIKRLREIRKVTQRDLADWLGVSRQAVSMWEADKRELKVLTLNKIAHVFGVSADEIMQLGQDGNIKKEVNMLKKSKAKKTTFKLEAPQANSVFVTGCFKGWDQKGIKMKKSKAGLWNIGVDLKPGRYEYKFIVDKQWWTDPANSNTVVSDIGIQNSVLEVAGK